MATCPSCNRPVAMARPTCVYCGAALPAETVSAVEEATASLRAGANTLRAPMSAAPSGAPAPDRWLLAVDATGRSASDLARFFGLPAYEAQQRERLGGLQLHRVGEEGAVRAEADRLASEGLSVTLVPEAEARTPPVLATGGEQQGGRLRLRTQEGPLEVVGPELFLLVHGPIVREYKARQVKGSAAVENKTQRIASLEGGYRFHLHRWSDPRPVELDPASFAFGVQGPVSGSSLLELKAWLADIAPQVAVDVGFKRLPPALAPAAPEMGAASSLRRSEGGGAGKDAPVILDNLGQFRFYSGWRAAVERRHGQPGRPL